jgi:hypothetical protein
MLFSLAVPFLYSIVGFVDSMLGLTRIIWNFGQELLGGRAAFFRRFSNIGG